MWILLSQAPIFKNMNVKFRKPLQTSTAAFGIWKTVF